MEKKQPIIELKHIKKCYTKDVPVIYDFNLTINEGEFVTFLGPSGCGKTTTLRILIGLLEPDEGMILLDGRDITRAAPDDRGMGIVFQNYALFPNMTVEQNILCGLKAEKDPAARRAACAEMLRAMRLETLAKRYPAQLSGGQQQRAAIARALITRPAVVLADEPTGNLDQDRKSVV